MALTLLKLRWFALGLLIWVPVTHCRNVTHEDIRDAMLSLVHMFRTSEDKLERHEYREKSLGDQLKKMITGLEKKHRMLEPLKGMISRLDERLSNVETILLQKEEKEKATQKKTSEALDAIQNSLQSISAAFKPKDNELSLEYKLTNEENSLDKRLDATDAKVDAVKREIEDLKNSLTKDSLRAMCLEVASNVNPLEKHITEAEKLLNKYELKLNEYGNGNGNGSRVLTDFVPLSEVSLADEAWHSKMTEVMERQESDIKKIEKLLSDAESMWKDLPRVADLTATLNQTLDAIEYSKRDLKENDERLYGQVAARLVEIDSRVASGNDQIRTQLTQATSMSERAYGDVRSGYDALRNEVQTLSKGEHVMLQTADNVIATKKRVEYGVHQILLEVGELVKAHGNHLNNTLNERFDKIENTISETERGALGNLSATLEAEMSQVWRQIGVMHQQLAASRQALDKLTEQTELYVNGSAKTMDNMKEKVSMITSRMSEVDENLNYVVGRVSLAAQEFARVKTALAGVLDTTRLNAAPARSIDAGPGPHNITSAEKTT